MLVSSDSYEVSGNFLDWAHHFSMVLNNNSIPFLSYDKPFSSLEISISNFQKLILTGYSLTLGHSFMSDMLMLRWAVLGSNDEENWFLIDERDFSTLEKIPETKCHFDCSPIGSYSFYKIMQTSKNSKGNHIMALSYFELYGELTE